MVTPISVPEGALATFDAVADDPDSGDVLSYSLVAGPDPVPAGASVDASGGFTWLTDEADGPGTYAFKLRVTVPANRYVEQPVSIDVSEANQSPILGPIGDRADPEGSAVSLPMTMTDPDLPAPILSFGAAGLSPGLALDSATGLISGNIDYSAATGSPYVVTITVHDDHAPPGVDSRTLTWMVSDVNRPPVIVAVPSNATIAPGAGYTGSVGAGDPDGETVAFMESGLPPGLTIDGGSGAITGTVASTATLGSYAVTVTVTDPAGASDTASFVVAVSSSSPPTATTTTEGCLNASRGRDRPFAGMGENPSRMPGAPPDR